MKKLSVKLCIMGLSLLPIFTYAQMPDNVESIYPPRQMRDCASFDIVSSGQVLEKINFERNTWVEGRNQKEYSLRITNQCNFRVLAVASVDGLNVLNGQKANYNQGGYIVEPGVPVVIPGWRKSDSNTAAFYFTYPEDSYAQRVSKGQNVGVIGVAFFKEEYIPPLPKPWPPGENIGDARSYNRSEAAPSARMQENESKADKSLGTGYGRNIEAPIVRSAFKRASDTPFSITSIRYETRNKLVQMGAIPSYNSPQAFPGNNGYVPPPPPRY